jgi:hypothetical protein
MKFKFMLIGLALALMLCISPVAAVSGSDFEVVIDESGDIPTYKYYDHAVQYEKYIHIITEGTSWLKSIVTFKPDNYPYAPVMVVDTNSKCDIYLPRSVDKWEIKYYSNFRKMSPPYDKYLKNSGVLNMRYSFLPWCQNGGTLGLELSSDQYLWGYSTEFYPGYYVFNYHEWKIPDVD